MLLFFVFAAAVACGDAGKKNDTRDTPETGSINISVDESFKPVIEEQIRVHKASFPKANIQVSYKSEAACFRDLQNDSTRMIIVAKGLTEKEAESYKSVLSYKPQYGILAYDAVAVIVNNEAKDSIFTIEKLKDILGGKNNIIAVMDGKSATSTVRFLQDSVLKGAVFGANVAAVNNSSEVIDLVSKRADVIGFVGLSWIGDSYDPIQRAYLKKIRLARVECKACLEYPLARPLYYILKENAAGLGTGFMNFMSLERGQLIFRRAFLAPAKMAFQKRNSSIKKE
jgi:phosphate transport system substrate-binding protein